MATKEISQLTSTNVSNDTDLLMTRQGSQDKAVQVEKVRNIGTETGNSLGVGGYGIGANAILITDIFSDDNVDLVQRDGLYRITLSTANKPSGVGIGEMLHIQTSNNDATQKLWGDNSKEYFRRKISGTWQTWVLVGALDKAALRTDLGVYSKTEADARYLGEADNLADLDNKATARTNLDVYSKAEALADTTGSVKTANLEASSVTGPKVSINSVIEFSELASGADTKYLISVPAGGVPLLTGITIYESGSTSVQKAQSYWRNIVYIPIGRNYAYVANTGTDSVNIRYRMVYIP